MKSLRASAVAVSVLTLSLAGPTVKAKDKVPGSISVAFGAGLNTGSAIVGGADSTALGDAVNAAFRLESATKGIGMGVALGERTYQELGVGAQAAFVRRQVELKGYEGPSIAWAISFEGLQGILPKPLV